MVEIPLIIDLQYKIYKESEVSELSEFAANPLTFVNAPPTSMTHFWCSKLIEFTKFSGNARNLKNVFLLY